MATYTLEMTRSITWEVEVEADSEEHALELSAEWGEDDMKDEEMTRSAWNVEVK